MSNKIMHTKIPGMIFRRPAYLAISVASFVLMFFIMLTANQILFLQPYPVLNLTDDTAPSFLLTLVIAVLTALVMPMTIFQFSTLKIKSKKAGTGLGGSLIGIISSICTGCGPVGISLISYLGVVGSTAVSFLDGYSIPIKIASIAILVATYFSLANGINSKCQININKCQ